MWIAAASKLQRAWRVHAFRRGLQLAPALRRAVLHAVTRLQALWRGRPARLAFLAQRAAAVKLQVVLSSSLSTMHCPCLYLTLLQRCNGTSSMHILLG